MEDPQALADREIVVTEKLDGDNTLIFQGEVYDRSGARAGPWAGLVKKHHAWKLAGTGLSLYGENLHPVHAIEYAPMAPGETFRAFALRRLDGTFESFQALEDLCSSLDIPTVPVLFRGRRNSAAELDQLIHRAHTEPSLLGGEREGVVVRVSGEIRTPDFPRMACKSVRLGHVQAEEHWRRNWKPCRLRNPHPSTEFSGDVSREFPGEIPGERR